MIFTGRSADGSDMHVALGVFVSPDGKEWSTKPFTSEQRVRLKQHRIYERCWNHIAKYRRTLRDEYNLIMEGKSILPKNCRNFIVQYIKEIEKERQS